MAIRFGAFFRTGFPSRCPSFVVKQKSPHLPCNRGMIRAAIRRSTHQLVSTDRKMPKKPTRTFGCPSEFTLEVLGGKWKTVILCYLRRQPLRFTDLRRLIPA